MPPLEPLCEYCSRIPFESPPPGPGFPWLLGPGEWIKRSNCPFCQFVVHAIQTFSQTVARIATPVLSNQSTVGLYWHRESGPGGRGAFIINISGYRIWICMAAGASNEGAIYSYRFLKPTLESEFEVGRLSEWISTCNRAHSEKCSVKTADFEQSFPGLDVVRFIDVEQESIVELRAVPRYLALSYVWGEVANIRLTTGNRSSLLLPGGIRKAGPKIPRTVRDAIELVRRLDARYLWVDTLCLVQNDPADLARGVNVMDEIYERSWLTIIAADGHNANAGLPGIQEGSRFRRIATRITDDISMGVYERLDHLLESSVYASRAWT